MKIIIIVMTALMLASCGGYFDADSVTDGRGGLQPLAIAGGGFLSSDTANDITPFFYHDSASGKSFLFFASDRSGNYDIFFAEMNSDGSFQAPVKLNTNLNTTNHEYSPVVFQSYRSGDVPTGTNIFISFVRIESGGLTTNIRTFLVSNTFNVYQMTMGADPTTANAKSIALLSKTNHMPVLLIAIGSTNVLQSTWNTPATSTSPCWNFPATMLVGSPYYIMGIDGYHIGTTMWTNKFIFSVMSFGKNSLFKGMVSSFPETNFEEIGAYKSESQDVQPSLDMTTMKVYYASDRYGLGNFDLYRYNYFTYWVVAP